MHLLTLLEVRDLICDFAHTRGSDFQDGISKQISVKLKRFFNRNLKNVG